VSCGVRDPDVDSGGNTGSEFVDADLCLAEDNCHGGAGLGDACGGSSANDGLLSPCSCACIILLRSFWDILPVKEPEVFGSVALADKPIESVDVRDEDACSMTSLMLSFVEGNGVVPQGLPGFFGEGIASADALW
jgi:hypothetical protein